MDDLRVSLVQTDLFWRDPAANLRQLEGKIRPLAGVTDLIVLPETFTSGITERPDKLMNTGYENDQLTCQWLLNQAQTINAAICGSSVIAVNSGFVNRLLFATPTGKMFHYDKVDRKSTRLNSSHLA